MQRRRRTTALILFFFVTLLSACSLLVSLDGLSGGPVDAMEAGQTDAPSVSADAAADSLLADAPIDARDSGTVAETDASWHFVSSDGIALPTNPDAATVAASQPVEVGDLVIFGCDTETRAGAITLDLPASIARLAPLGPFHYPASTDGYEAVVFIGTIAQAPPGGALSITARPAAATGFLDCSINVYRGGTAAAHVVDSKVTSGTGAGLANCGPVTTTRGGVAYYIAVRYSCAGPPLQTFKQENQLEGNPNGDLVPTDGAVVQSQLSDCNSSVGNWLCLTVAVSP